jgi:hypothetical protein
MASIVVAGDTSGTVTLAAPAVSGTTTLTLPTTSGTIVTTSGAQTIEFADGSASTPSITNSGDTNTGMFFPAADTIAFSEGGTEVMRIDSSGIVTMPYQPAVHAGLTGSNGNTTASPIVWNSVLTNVGNHYNSSTGLFTCPVNAVYEVFASACVQVTANGGWDLIVRKNGTQVSAQYGKGFFELYSNPFSGYPMMTVKMLISCSANDTLAVGGTVYRESGTSYSTFNIRLVS